MTTRSPSRRRPSAVPRDHGPRSMSALGGAYGFGGWFIAVAPSLHAEASGEEDEAHSGGNPLVGRFLGDVAFLLRQSERIVVKLAVLADRQPEEGAEAERSVEPEVDAAH